MSWSDRFHQRKVKGNGKPPAAVTFTPYALLASKTVHTYHIGYVLVRHLLVTEEVRAMDAEHALVPQGHRTAAMLTQHLNSAVERRDYITSGDIEIRVFAKD